MTTRHNISQADTLYHGKVRYELYNKDQGLSKGIEMSHVKLCELGAVAALDVDALCDDVDMTASGAVSVSGTLATGGVGTIASPRGLSVTFAAGTTATITITGTDEYGETVVEDIAGTASGITAGVKAFSTVTSVTTDEATATGSPVNVGVGDVFGLPFYVEDAGKVVSVSQSGSALATGLTVTAGVTTTATATTGDVRGTITGHTGDASTYLTATILIDDPCTTKAAAFGVAQYAG